MIIGIKYYIKCFFFSRSYTISSICIYTLVVGNTPYGRRHISRTEPVLLQASYLRLKLSKFHSPQPFLYRYQISSMHSSTRKTPLKRTLKMSLRHLLVNLKNVRVLAPPMFFSIELWRQWQPIIFPPIQASNGAPRSIEHERCNVVIRVRCCKMPKIQE